MQKDNSIWVANERIILVTNSQILIPAAYDSEFVKLQVGCKISIVYIARHARIFKANAIDRWELKFKRWVEILLGKKMLSHSFSIIDFMIANATGV